MTLLFPLLHPYNQTHQLTAALDAQFLIQPVDVVLNRVEGDEEGILDFLVAFSCDDEFHDLLFPAGETVLLKERAENRMVFRNLIASGMPQMKTSHPEHGNQTRHEEEDRVDDQS